MTAVQHTPKPPKAPKVLWKNMTPEQKVEDNHEKIGAILVAGLILALGLFASVILVARMHHGPSDATIRTQAEVTMAQDLGLSYSNGKVLATPGGVMQVTAKKEACKLTARQAVNFKLTDQPIEKLLAACDSITQ